MKSIITKTIGIFIMIAGSAFADTGAVASENGWLWILFLGFAAVIIVFQLIPSVILLGAMLKGAFGAPIKSTTTAGEITKS
jgi:uncharacterized membrane protein